MLSFLLKKGAIPFTEKEDLFVKELIRIFRDHCQREGAFLHQVDIDRYQFFWSPYMRDHQEGIFGGIMGCWDPGTRWKIYLVPREETQVIEVPEYWKIGDVQAIESGGYLLLKEIASITMHELCHAWQFSVNPILWIINRLVTQFVEYIPYLKKITIEHDVDKHISENQEVLEFLQGLSNTWDAYLYLLRNEKSVSYERSRPNQDEETIELRTTALRYAEEEFMKHPEWRRKAVVSLFTIMA